MKMQMLWIACCTVALVLTFHANNSEDSISSMLIGESLTLVDIRGASCGEYCDFGSCGFFGGDKCTLESGSCSGSC